MHIGNEHDASYQEKIQDAVLKAIMEASVSTAPDGRPVAMMRAGEIADALIGITAYVMASSSSTRNRAGRKRFSDGVAKQLNRQITQFRQHAAEHGSVMRTVSMPTETAH
jgi:hypothetical protein